MSNNEYLKQWRQANKDKGMCAECGKNPPRPNLVNCQECTVKKEYSRQRRRAERKANSQCTECGKPKANTSETYCLKCSEKHRRQIAERIERLRRKGVCVRCGQCPAAKNIQHCENCQIKQLSSRNLGSSDRWQELKALLEKQNRKCVYTGWELRIGDGASLDHRNPRKTGGTDDLENLQWVHERVNQAKWEYPENDLLELAKAIVTHRNL